MQNWGDVMSDRNLGERETNLRGNAIGKTRRRNKPGEPTEQHGREETTNRTASKKTKPAIPHDDKGATEAGRKNEETETGTPRPGRRNRKDAMGKRDGPITNGDKIRIGATQQNSETGGRLKKRNKKTPERQQPEAADRKNETKKTPKVREADPSRKTGKNRGRETRRRNRKTP